MRRVGIFCGGWVHGGRYPRDYSGGAALVRELGRARAGSGERGDMMMRDAWSLFEDRSINRCFVSLGWWWHDDSC